MKELGMARKILGIDIFINEKHDELFLHQIDYVGKVLRKFNMNKSKSLSIPMGMDCKMSISMSPKTHQDSKEMSPIPYANVVGSIIYLMICTMPDLSHAISVMSRYMTDPGKQHWKVLKRILRYLNGSANAGILYKHVECKTN